MKKSGYYMSILAGSIVFLKASTCHAFIPTIDASAIAEGIKSNIELVKQSKVVVDATKLTGQISSTLGEMKASISELALDELKKAKEFVEKQKENYEKAKEDYEKYKKEAEAAQAELEEGKKLLEDAKKEVEDAKDKVGGTVSDVTNAYNNAKDKYEKAKGKVDGFIEDATKAYNDAKGYYDDAKDAYNDVKGYYDKAKGYYEEGKDKLNDALDKAENIYDKVDSTINKGSSSGSTTTPSYTPSYGSSTTPTDLASAQSEIESLRAEIEKLKVAAQVQTGYNNEGEESINPQNLEEALDEIARLREELAKYQGGDSSNTTEEDKTLPTIDENQQSLQPINGTSETGIRTRIPFSQPTNTTPSVIEESEQSNQGITLQPINETPAVSINPLNGTSETGIGTRIPFSQPTNTTPSVIEESEQSNQGITLQPINEAPAVSINPRTTTTEELSQPQKLEIPEENTINSLTPSTTLPSVKGFRQRPVIDNTTLYDINASAEEFVAEKYAYSVEVSERLNFAQLDAATGDAPTGDNDVTGEFIISKEMAQHCKVNINIATIDQLEDCIKEIITYRSNPDMKVAEKGDALVDKIFYENAVGTAAAAMYAHNKASHYKEEVLIPMKADSAEGQSDVRDDISVLTSAQEQIQNLLIDLTKAYAAQVYQQSIKDALQTRLKDIDPEAALAAQNANQKSTE